MKKLINLIIISVIMIFFSSQIFASNMAKKVDKNSEEIKTKYNIEETTEIMKSNKLGSIKLDHDDHVYKCMKISKNAKNLDGAVDILIEANTKLGYTLDDEEVNLIIELSKIDTNLYKDIISSARKIGKKKTTVKEHNEILSVINNDNGKYLFTGIERAAACRYKIENDYFSEERLNLLVEVGKLEKEDRFLDIYAAMKRIGMDNKVNSKGLEVLYKLYQVDGDVAYKINEYLKVNKWKSRKQPGKREYVVIKDLMKANYAAHDKKSDYDKITVFEKKPESKKIKKVVATKKRYFAENKKIIKRNNKEKEYRDKSYSPCSAYVSKN